MSNAVWARNSAMPRRLRPSRIGPHHGLQKTASSFNFNTATSPSNPICPPWQPTNSSNPRPRDQSSTLPPPRKRNPPKQPLPGQPYNMPPKTARRPRFTSARASPRSRSCKPRWCSQTSRKRIRNSTMRSTP